VRIARIKNACFAVALSMSLTVALFAAPLCACLNSSQTKTHICCEKMRMHCPMEALKSVSSGTALYLDCDCSVKKHESTPGKISESLKVQKDHVTTAFQIFFAESFTEIPVSQNYSDTDNSSPDPTRGQTPARAPPAF
jgi:hypothetical protein